MQPSEGLQYLIHVRLSDTIPGLCSGPTPQNWIKCEISSAGHLLFCHGRHRYDCSYLARLASFLRV